MSHDDLNKGQLPGLGREAWLRGVLPPPPPTLSFSQATRKTDSFFPLFSNIDKIDDIGRTALHYACRNGHYEVGKFLLDNGAMPSTKTFTTGATPLHLAAKHGYGRICKLLLERGASKNERDIDGRTALDIAMQAEKQDSIDALQ